MAKTSKSTTPAKASETKSAKSESAAPAATSAEATPASAETPPASDAGSTKKSSGGGGRPISYFSSVATDEYRSGWADIFGTPAQKSAGASKAKPASSRRKSKLPTTLELDVAALDDDLRGRLEDLFRRQARKKRLNYDKLSENDQVRLSISCHIDE